MDSIFKTPNGMYIDLSKIVAISDATMTPFYIYYQLREKPVEYWAGFNTIKEEHGIIVNAWKGYKGEKTEGVKVAQPDLQTRL